MYRRSLLIIFFIFFSLSSFSLNWEELKKLILIRYESLPDLNFLKCLKENNCSEDEFIKNLALLGDTKFPQINNYRKRICLARDGLLGIIYIPLLPNKKVLCRFFHDLSIEKDSFKINISGYLAKFDNNSKKHYFNAITRNIYETIRSFIYSSYDIPDNIKPDWLMYLVKDNFSFAKWMKKLTKSITLFNLPSFYKDLLWVNKYGLFIVKYDQFKDGKFRFYSFHFLENKTFWQESRVDWSPGNNISGYLISDSIIKIPKNSYMDYFTQFLNFTCEFLKGSEGDDWYFISHDGSDERVPYGEEHNDYQFSYCLRDDGSIMEITENPYGKE